MSKVTLTWRFAILALLATSCQPPAPEMAPARTPEAVQADLAAARDSWQAMANADDFAGVAAMYTEDAVYIDQYGQIHQGRQAISDYFQESLGSSSGYDIQVSGTVSDGDMVGSYGSYTVTVMGPEGEMPMSGLWQTVALYQPDGSLKIRLHLGMVPMEAPTM